MFNSLYYLIMLTNFALYATDPELMPLAALLNRNTKSPVMPFVPDKAASKLSTAKITPCDVRVPSELKDKRPLTMEPLTPSCQLSAPPSLKLTSPVTHYPASVKMSLILVIEGFKVALLNCGYRAQYPR